MENNRKIVTQMPMTFIWTDSENIIAKREKYLTADDIQEVLKNYPVEFVIANIGEKLKWISADQSFDFWKTEVKPHLADDINNIDLDDFMDNYAYVASEWSGGLGISIILLEKYH